MVLWEIKFTPENQEFTCFATLKVFNQQCKTTSTRTAISYHQTQSPDEKTTSIASYPNSPPTGCYKINANEVFLGSHSCLYLIPRRFSVLSPITEPCGFAYTALNVSDLTWYSITTQTISYSVPPCNF
jgi:hypothetical protein